VREVNEEESRYPYFILSLLIFRLFSTYLVFHPTLVYSWIRKLADVIESDFAKESKVLEVGVWRNLLLALAVHSRLPIFNCSQSRNREALSSMSTSNATPHDCAVCSNQTTIVCSKCRNIYFCSTRCQTLVSCFRKALSSIWADL